MTTSPFNHSSHSIPSKMFNRKAPISDAMTANVKTVSPNTTMDKVAEIFTTHSFHHIPIVNEDGMVIGIISSTEQHMLEDHFTLFKRKESQVANDKIMRSLLAKEVMTKKVATVRPDDTLDYAVDIFRENLFHALPVVDKNKKLVGILTPYDVMTWAFRNEPAAIE